MHSVIQIQAKTTETQLGVHIRVVIDNTSEICRAGERKGPQ